MKDTVEYLWRVRVTSYPEGAFTPEVEGDDGWHVPTPGWSPPGWSPDEGYVEILGTTEFIWPVTNRSYGSRSTAKKRADLLQRYGATVVIERSERVMWPEQV
jgi:hypothetical protein